MKRFNQYKLSKNDKQIIKNFKIDRDFRILSKDELDEYWRKILKLSTDIKYESHIKRFYKPLLDMRCYVAIINNTEYFFFDYNDKNFYNVFFYNMDNIKGNNISSLTNSRESIEIFKVICSILIEERKQKRTLSYRIKLPNKNTKFWFKLIDKVNRELWKYSQLTLKKIKNEYYYFYRGDYSFCHRLRYLRGMFSTYKKPFIDIDSYVQKYKAK